MSKKRIGILTSGGDCPGLNAVIRGAVKACYQLGYDCVGFLKGYEGLHDPVQYVHLTPDSTRGILTRGGTILGSTNKGRFAATVGVQDRVEIAPNLIDGVKQTIDQLGIDGLICVGGDGSLAVAQQFHENGINVVGVPKTIDNDLSATAFTFGFDSAIECATDALDRLHTTAASHERIMVLEVMGRHAGWIALHAGIAGGGDVILIPEVDWSYEHLCHKILHRESQGKNFTLVVVAEGAELPGGDVVGEQRDGQQMRLGGVGRAVAAEIERRLHRETRLSILGHLQRGGSPTTFDRVLATQFGAHAVRLIKEQRFGEMICSRPPEMTSVPIMEAVNVLRRVDPHGPAVQAARALGISFGDRPADELGHDVFSKDEAKPAIVAPEETPSFDEHSLGDDLSAAPAAAIATHEPQPIADKPAAEVATEVPSLEAPIVVSVAATDTETTDAATPEEETEVLQAADLELTAPPTAETIAEAQTPETAEPNDEDVAVKEVAESVLEMLDEADVAAHGPLVEDIEEFEPEPAHAEEELPETDADPTETVAALEELDEPVAGPIAEVAPPASDEPTEPTEPEEAATEPAAETPSAEAAPTVEPAAKPGLDENSLADAQALLAQRIAAAASEQRDEANDSKVEPAAAGIDVAELVKQKLAAVSLEVPAAEPAPTPDSEPHAAEAAPAASSKRSPTLAAPTDASVDDDLVAQARVALEAALAD
ncbi:MAG: ATP-dependent 6-phosphofructokinase [Planctomycetota bacterium]